MGARGARRVRVSKADYCIAAAAEMGETSYRHRDAGSMEPKDRRPLSR